MYLPKSDDFPTGKKSCWDSENSPRVGWKVVKEDDGYSVKVPSGLARSSIHPSAQLCLQIPPSLLAISPAKLYISVIVSKKPARPRLGDGKETPHQGWEHGKAALRQRSRGHTARPKTRFVTLSKGEKMMSSHLCRGLPDAPFLLQNSLEWGETVAPFRRRFLLSTREQSSERG